MQDHTNKVLVATPSSKNQAIFSFNCMTCLNTGRPIVSAQQIISCTPHISVVLSIGEKNITLCLDDLREKWVRHSILGQPYQVVGCCIVARQGITVGSI